MSYVKQMSCTSANVVLTVFLRQCITSAAVYIAKRAQKFEVYTITQRGRKVFGLPLKLAS